jgi:hypothetical protein
MKSLKISADAVKNPYRIVKKAKRLSPLSASSRLKIDCVIGEAVLGIAGLAPSE